MQTTSERQAQAKAEQCKGLEQEFSRMRRRARLLEQELEAMLRSASRVRGHLVNEGFGSTAQLTGLSESIESARNLLDSLKEGS